MAGHGVPHHADNPEQKRIGIFVAVLAVIMALVSAFAKQQANAMIVKEVQASNGFSWYQSKRQRSYMNELELKRIDFELAGTPNTAQRKQLEETQSKLRAKNAEYERENDEIRAAAEKDRHLAELASHKHHQFEYAEVLLHVAVVLCSLTLLTTQSLFFRLGIAATALGLLLATKAYFTGDHGHSHAPDPTPAQSGQAASPAGTAKPH